ncbi:MAG: fluoride efflux transporter CrcB [Synechococcales bacterium]|nr:fluoride efflux transporter CrcB [Synechococcales bacterium]
MQSSVTLFGLLAIAIGAIPGAVSRYYLTEFCKQAMGPDFPYGTFIINLSGCFLMGFFFTLFKGIPGFSPEIDLFIRTGFLGAYTTFSTYGYDTLTLWQNDKPGATFLYWAGSATLAVLGAVLGRSLALLWIGASSFH